MTCSESDVEIAGSGLSVAEAHHVIERVLTAIAGFPVGITGIECTMVDRTVNVLFRAAGKVED
jgi:hypothetical protein